MQIEKYKRRAKHNVSESTLRSRMSALRNFNEFLDKEEPEVEDVEEWVDHLIERYEKDEIKTGTIKQYFKCVRYYFSTVKGEDDSLDHIKNWIPSGDTDHGDYLTQDELARMESNTYQLRERAIIRLMYRYARRPGEVILLNMDDITMGDDEYYMSDPPEGDWERGTITFNILKKREPFRATFELTSSCRNAIQEYMEHRMDVKEEAEHEWEEGEEVSPLFTTLNGRVSYDTVWKNMKQIAERTGLDKNITPKSMRHSRATHLDWAGNSPGEIARQQLVHEPDSDVIGAYIHDRSEEQVREVMEVEGDDE